MRTTSGNRFTIDNSSNNFFEVGSLPQPASPLMPLPPGQSYSRPSTMVQHPTQLSSSEHLNSMIRPALVTSQQQIQAAQDGISPTRMRLQVFDNDPKASITSFERSALPRRPMSQVPTTRSTGFEQTSQYQSRQLGPQTQLGASQTPPQFGQTQSSYQFSQSGLQFGQTREALRENIQKKGALVTELNQNKAFFREALDRKSAEFKEVIRNDLKKTVFDKVLKTNLHYIYKHYENLKSTVNREETLRILHTNLAKQQKEVVDGRNALLQTEAADKGLEERLLSMVNQPGVVRARPTIVEGITKEDMDRKVIELRRQNAEIEQALEALRRRRDKELYDLKMKHENKGRVVMEQRAIRLALQYVDPQDYEQLTLKQRIGDMVRVIEANDAARKSNQNYMLNEKKEKLEKELEVLRFYSI